MKILIAEDDPVSRKLLQLALAKSGHEIIVATDGLDAWKLLQGEEAPKLALLDWMMPGMDGVAICREIRKRPEGQYVYILLVTAKSTRQDFLEAMGAGADNYVTKPVDPQALMAHVRTGVRILELQQELVAARQSLEAQATHDSLTKLPNRLMFSVELSRRIEEARRHSHMVGVMYLDMDHFKAVNDTLGHDSGDLLLNQVAARLTDRLRPADLVARMGGDEFTVIVPNMTNARIAEKVARRVLQAFSEPFMLKGKECSSSTSIGISHYPADGTDVETLVKNADAAMYRAKDKGGNCIEFYAHPARGTSSQRSGLEADLSRALANGELLAHYQPRIAVSTGKITCAEALLRWQHPAAGLLPPADFIELAEETGLIVPIDDFMLRTACAQNKAWQDAGFAPISVAVNVSERRFNSQGFKETVRAALKHAGLAPQYLTLELGECTLVADPSAAVHTLRKLKAMGVRTAIDGFGTRCSSLTSLKHFPVDVVKVDRSFVKGITSESGDAGIARAVVAMAHSLGMEVVAEGVETPAQLELLASFQCDAIQGYFVSTAVPAARFEDLLRNPLVLDALQAAA